MDIRQNPLWLSVPCGHLFRTQIRISVWYLLIAFIFCLQLGLQLGLAVSILLLLSLLIHEFAHIFAARSTGGSGHEILIWPLGGLAFTNPAPVFSAELWTILGGPLANGLICLACLPFVLSSGNLGECTALLYVPRVDLSVDMLQGLALLMFSINYKLLIINLLLPIFPLDGGQLIYTIGKVYWDRQTAKVGSLWIGLGASVILILSGWYFRSVDIIFLASVLFTICQYEFLVSQVSRNFDDSFMGYDFSQGYTSLEGDDDREAARRPGMLERWRRQRAEKKRQHEQQQRIETDRRLDELLEKVHQQGMSSLTADERRFLQRASNRYRSPGKE